MPGREKLSEFVAWCDKNITGMEKGQSQIFLGRLFRAVGQPGSLAAAVLTAYGFSAKKDLLAQLLALNQDVAANIEKRSPITAPGVP
jgi:hypothetical protein